MTLSKQLTQLAQLTLPTSATYQAVAEADGLKNLPGDVFHLFHWSPESISSFESQDLINSRGG